MDETPEEKPEERSYFEERRRQLRTPIELRVEYKRLNSFFADYTKNIGQGGTFIRTEKPLNIGTEFTFKLVIPNLEEPLELHGRVQWIVRPEDLTEGQDPGMGIGFVYQSEADRHRIENLVEKLMIDSLGEHIYEQLLGSRKRY
ncbi:MAG: TIGR02266 family protein [Myxococcota bacterium]